MTATLVLSNPVMNEIMVASGNPLETAGVLRAVLVRTPAGHIRLLGRGIDWVPDNAYLDRRHDGLGISSEGYVGSLGKAEARGEIAIWFHTHPGVGSSPRPSQHDEQVDGQIADLFRVRTGQEFYGTLIVAPTGHGIAFTGTLQHEDGARFALDRLWDVSDTWRLVKSYNDPSPPLASMFDRNVRAFGGEVQRTLSELTIGIVGTGGTGSAVAEQLVRVGVRHLHVIDADELSLSNVTRVYGSHPDQVGQPKAEVVRDHLLSIAPDLDCQVQVGMIVDQPIARELCECDLVFGCTDDNAGRLVLSRLGTYMLTPVIDMGVLLSSDHGGNLRGIDGRVTVMAPGTACLLCRNRIDVRRAAAELMNEDERHRLAGEGYAPVLAGVEPAVVTFTTAVAAAATSELLERLTGYGPDPRPSEVLLRLHDREISTNIVEPREHHYCHPASGKQGLGNTTPWLEQVWRNA
ncbi:ThiF family adenylyltransferase [Mesorhizobium sp. M0968]|uniref:ThiF family adenylyltransferase n=1 Tax=Mesorhizobium sp. M0968 TaxID=2957037 RepID=UPI00333A06F1